MRYVQLLRHTDNDGDRLTSKGIAAAETIGRERLTPPYALFGTTGASRRALVVGHSPTNEAAVLGLAAEVVGPLGKGEGVLVIEDDSRFHAEPF